MESLTLVKLEPLNLHWINESDDNAEDLCFHGNVVFGVDDVIFVDPSHGDLTLSASGLFLLRTLELPHSVDAPVSEDNQLFPHCGFTVWPAEVFKGESAFSVVIPGCDRGVDLRIDRSPGIVTVSDYSGRARTCSESDWRSAVLGFAQRIEDFYDSSPKRAEPPDELAQIGWNAFWAEWRSRKAEFAAPG